MTTTKTVRSSLLIEDDELDKKNTKSYLHPCRICIAFLSIVILMGVVLIILHSQNLWPFEDKSTAHRVTPQDIDELRILLAEAFRNSTVAESDPEPLISTLVRLVFHDCGGVPTIIDEQFQSDLDIDPRYNLNAITICDGCIDFSDLEKHAYLQEFAVEPLEPIYGLYESKMSRADFWVTAGLIALEYASNPSNPPRNHSLLPPIEVIPNLGFWFGRVDCALSPDADESGGNFPLPEHGWDDTYQWFNYHLNFSVRETVAIIGAHTLGRAHLNASGYSNPWVFLAPDLWGSQILDNLFYTFVSSQVSGWKQYVVPESGRIQWMNSPQLAMMFNSDISLWMRIVDDLDLNDQGRVNCSFVEEQGKKMCARQRSTADIVMEYAKNNSLWLMEFAKVFQKMTFAGYDVENDDNFYFVESELL